jgi:hypothetical protein
MKKYKVIWFDDKHSELNLIKESAFLRGISLVGYTNAKEGIDELERNISEYDAAIVDGNFFKTASQSEGDVSDDALFEVGIALERLKPRKVLPWFILSGQINFTKEENKYARGFKANVVYDKNNEDHLQKLWDSVIAEADEQIETQIKNDYRRVFEVCNDKYIGTAASKPLLSILKKESAINAFSDPELYFVPLRKVMEDLFTACYKYGLLPECFIKPSVALNEASKFLSGSAEKGYQLDTPVSIKIISDHIRGILAICQPAAHRAEIDNFVSTVNSPYLLLSTTYQLLDVLLWFKDYFNNNNDVEANKARVKLSDPDTLIAIIEKDDLGNYHCGDVLLSYRFVNDNGFQVGDEIRIVSAIENTIFKTKHLYPKFANKIAKA